MAAHAGKHVGALCSAIHRDKGEWGVKGILGVRALIRQHGVVTVDDACAAALDMGVPTYRFVRRYLEHRPRPPLALRQIHPLIRQLTLYRDHINRITKENPDEPRAGHRPLWCMHSRNPAMNRVRVLVSCSPAKTGPA